MTVICNAENRHRIRRIEAAEVYGVPTLVLVMGNAEIEGIIAHGIRYQASEAWVEASEAWVEACAHLSGPQASVGAAASCVDACVQSSAPQSVLCMPGMCATGALPTLWPRSSFWAFTYIPLRDAWVTLSYSGCSSQACSSMFACLLLHEHAWTYREHQA